MSSLLTDAVVLGGLLFILSWMLHGLMPRTERTQPRGVRSTHGHVTTAVCGLVLVAVGVALTYIVLLLVIPLILFVLLLRGVFR